MDNKPFPLLIIPSVIILGLISFLPAKTIQNNNLASVVDPQAVNQMPPPIIDAQSALAVDLANEKVLFEKDSKIKLPLASLTKIISSLVIEDILPSDDVVRISKSAVATEGESYLRVGEHFEVKDLLAMVMIESSNDAVSALVETAATKQNIVSENTNDWFTGLMQDKASDLGTSNMTFYNPIGLDVSTTTAGSYGSAEDIIQIVKKSFSSDIWRFSSEQRIISKEGKVHTFHPTNILAGDIPQLIGSKTGYTEIAGGNLLILFEYPINHPMAVVVLGSTSAGRFDDAKTLFDYVKNVVTVE